MSESELSAICVHPNGIHQIAFAHLPRAVGAIGEETEGEEENEEEMEVGPERRMSLEGCISVAVEMEVRPSSPDVVKQLEVVEEVVLVKIEDDIAIESSTVNVPEELLVKKEPAVESPLDEPVPNVKSTPVIPPTTAPRSAKAQAKIDAKTEAAKVDPKLVNDAWTNGRATPPVVKKSTGGRDKEKEKTKEVAKAVAKDDNGLADVLKQLRRLEDTLPAKIAKIFQEEMGKQG